MNKNLFTASVFFVVLISIVSFQSIAQNENLDTTLQMKLEKKRSLNRNIIKTNITGILLKNYSLQYERTLNKSISIAISYRIMPSTNIPFKSSILKIVGGDPDTKRTIRRFQIKQYGVNS